jgi:hypothetical protein
MKLSKRNLMLFVLTITFTFSLFKHFTHAETVPFDSPRFITGCQPGNCTMVRDIVPQ